MDALKRLIACISVSVSVVRVLVLGHVCEVPAASCLLSLQHLQLFTAGHLFPSAVLNPVELINS
jgi:hypothetical protein